MRSSFDVYLPDGRSLTAESRKPGWWSLYLYSADCRTRDSLGTISGTRDQAMLKAEDFARAIARDKVTA